MTVAFILNIYILESDSSVEERVDSHRGVLPGPVRVSGISWPLASTHQHCWMLAWHCVDS